jgi:hypothetical protein
MTGQFYLIPGASLPTSVFPCMPQVSTLQAIHASEQKSKDALLAFIQVWT